MSDLMEAPPMRKTGGDPPKRPGRRARFVRVLVALVVVGAATALVTDRTILSGGEDDARPGPQRILDGLVAGPDRVAPGVTAYVSGPQGTWIGSAGIANAETGTPMPPDARFRLESVSKIWTATVILQLAQEGTLELDNTVEQWLPGTLPYGDQITIQQLLTNTSGLVDDNDLLEFERFESALANVQDAELQARITDAAERFAADPSLEVPPTLIVELAAWQPLLFTPGTQYHHSNIGFNILGLIAERAAGEDLRTLFSQRVSEPLGLHNTAYDPQGPISGPHANGYEIAGDGQVTDRTNEHVGKGADGGIVSDATDTATFLTRLMQGELLDREHLYRLRGDAFWNGGRATECAGTAFDALGAGDGYIAYVLVNRDGSRVAVLLLNGRRAATGVVDEAVITAATNLYCAA